MSDAKKSLTYELPSNKSDKSLNSYKTNKREKKLSQPLISLESATIRAKQSSDGWKEEGLGVTGSESQDTGEFYRKISHDSSRKTTFHFLIRVTSAMTLNPWWTAPAKKYSAGNSTGIERITISVPDWTVRVASLKRCKPLTVMP